MAITRSIRTVAFTNDPEAILATSRRLFSSAEARRNAYAALACNMQPGDRFVTQSKLCPVSALISCFEDGVPPTKGPIKSIFVLQDPPEQRIFTTLSQMKSPDVLVVIVPNSETSRLSQATLDRPDIIAHDRTSDSFVCIYRAQPPEGDPHEFDLDEIDDPRLILHAMAANKPLAT